MNLRRLPTSLLLPLILSIPLVVVHGAGGGIEGMVTDPKGALVVGAAILVSDPVNNQSFTAVTDAQGKYKVEGLPPGTYTIVVSSKGFADARRGNVKVNQDGTVRLDIKLELAPVETAGPINVIGLKPNSDPVYQQLRERGKSDQDLFGKSATVTNLVLKRDAATFTLRSGEVYFLAPVEGRVTGGVFIGDGELSLMPPTEVERRSLAIFAEQPELKEQFATLILRFTDTTFDEITQSPTANIRPDGAQAGRARDLYRSNQALLRKRLRTNLDLRTLESLYAPELPGFFVSFIDGRRFGKLVFALDPQGIHDVSPEEVMLLSYGETDEGIWTSFHLADEYRSSLANSAQDRRLFDITHHEIEGAIKGTQISAKDRATFRPLVPGLRVLPFDLYRSLRVGRVQDERNEDLNFIQEDKDEDADFAVIYPKPLEVGKSYQVTIDYQGGEALSDSGGGNFILLPRSTWYPNNAGTQFGDRATFNMTMKFPKSLMFIATGAPSGPEVVEKDTKVAKWTSGTTELAVAGFNYGKFKKKEVVDKDTGYGVEFYANTEIPDELRGLQVAIEQFESRMGQGSTETTLGSMSTTGMAGAALAEAQNSLRIFNVYFGKLPYSRLAMTQQPAGFFGQAWPTLVFMPYLAFIDDTQRVQIFGAQGGTDSFWKYVGPHEIAHQWWGHTIGWTSYHDQWMSEGFAEFSASLYVQYVRKDLNKFIDFWENQRQLIVEVSPETKGRKPYTVGPVTQGYRLNSAKTGSVARLIIYPKGAYILHMLRMMFFSSRTEDQRFQGMMKDFVKTHYNRDVSTEDFKRSVEKHMTEEMNVDGNGRLDWFFNQWVYGTEIPSYRFVYQLGPDGQTLSGRLTQSVVSDGFKMLVPIYLDFGKGWVRLGTVTIVGNSTLDVAPLKLPRPAKRAAICALNDVLALSIQNK